MKNYRTLDAIVVCASLAMLLGVFLALTFVEIPQANLPILAGLVGATVGSMLTAYAGARWGNKKTDEPARDGQITGSVDFTTTPEPQG